MNIPRACYSLSKLNETVKMVKSVTWEAKTKKEHFAKWAEIEKVFQFASDNLNRFLFDPEIELKDYRRAAYSYQNYSKSELDEMLRFEHRYIANELNAIKRSIDLGEVDYCE